MRVDARIAMVLLSLAGSALAQDDKQVFEPGTKTVCVPTADHRSWDCTPAGQAAAQASNPAPPPPAPASPPPAESAAASAPSAPPPAAPRSKDVPSYLLAAPQDNAAPATGSQPQAAATSEPATVTSLPETAAPAPAEYKAERKAREKREAEEARRVADERKAQEKQERDARAAQERKAAEDRKAQERQEAEARKTQERQDKENRAAQERQAKEERKAQEKQAREEREAQRRQEQEAAKAPPPAAPADTAPVTSPAPPSPVEAAPAPAPEPPPPPPPAPVAALADAGEFARLPGTAFFLELARGGDRESVANTARGLGLSSGKLYLVQHKNQGADWYVLAWGPFDTVESARAARNEAAAAGIASVGYPRRIAPLQQEIRSAGH